MERPKIKLNIEGEEITLIKIRRTTEKDFNGKKQDFEVTFLKSERFKYLKDMYNKQNGTTFSFEFDKPEYNTIIDIDVMGVLSGYTNKQKAAIVQLYVYLEHEFKIVHFAFPNYGEFFHEKMIPNETFEQVKNLLNIKENETR